MFFFLLTIGQTVKGLVYFFAKNLILHRHHGSDKDIVQRFGFHAYIQLLDAKAEPSDEIVHGPKDDGEARLSQTLEFTKGLNDWNMQLVRAETSARVY